MARIFLSHASPDTERAIALRDWLNEQGWQDIYLDVDPEHGIVAGESWQANIRAGLQGCDAAIFLISANWLDSRWCQAEYLVAKNLGKRCFPVMVEDVDIKRLPVEMSAEVQIVDLIHDAEAYVRLRLGLAKAGLGAESFVFPEGRRPYPGLMPLTEDDPAIFFGRDAQILAALDELRRMAEGGERKLLVLLGASGAGKSSLLRAGLWPRLARDDQTFLPLPALRPERNVLSGPSGLFASLERTAGEPALARHLPAPAARTRAGFSEALGAGAGANALSDVLEPLRAAAAMHALLPDARRPTAVLLIDQGEELFNPEGRTESERFLALLGAALCADPKLVAVIAIRSDAYGLLQTRPELPVNLHEHFSLGPMGPAGFKDVIEGPARLAGLKIEPALTEALLQDARGSDALPLLAFTLERLYLQYGADGDLTLAEYHALGGVSGAIAAAVNKALADPPRSLPAERAALDRLMRALLIPHLVRVSESGDFARRVAARDEIPPETAALAELLIDQRILVSDRRADSAETLEIAHEALLREWPQLKAWLAEERDFLSWREQVARARAGWKKGERGLLAERELQIAGGWLQRRRADLLEEDIRFVEESLAAEAERQRRARRRTRLALLLSSGAAVGFAVLGGLAWLAQKSADEARLETFVRQADLSASLAFRLFDQGSALLGLKLARSGAPADLDSAPLTPRLALALSRGWAQVQEEAELRHPDGDVLDAAWSPDGRFIATATLTDGARIWQAADGTLLKALGERLQPDYLLFEDPQMVRFDAAGEHLATQFDDRVSTWAPDGNRQRFTAPCKDAENRYLRLSSDGRLLAATCGDVFAIWDTASGETRYRQPAPPPGDRGEALAWGYDFTPGGARLVRIGPGSLVVHEGLDSTTPSLRTLSGFDALMAGGNFSSVHPTTKPAEFILRGAAALARVDIDEERVLWSSELGERFGGSNERWLAHLPATERIGLAQIRKDELEYAIHDARTLAQVAVGSVRFTGDLWGARVNRVDFAPDGEALAISLNTGVMALRVQDAQAQQFELYSGPCSGSSGGASAARFSPDGSRLLMICGDGATRVIRLAMQALAEIPAEPGPLARLAGFGEGFVRLDPKEQGGARFVRLARDGAAQGESPAIAEPVAFWTADAGGRAVIWVTASGRLGAWQPGTPAPLEHASELAPILAARFSPDGTRAALLDRSGRFVRVRLGEAAPEADLRLEFGALPPIDYSISPDLERIAFSTKDAGDSSYAFGAPVTRLAVLIEPAAGAAALSCFESKGPVFAAARFAELGEGRTLFLVDARKAVRRVDLAAPDARSPCPAPLLAQLRATPSWEINTYTHQTVRVVDAAGTARLLFGAAAEAPFELIDLASGEQLTDLVPSSGGEMPVALSRDGLYVATIGDGRSAVEVFDLASGTLLRRIRIDARVAHTRDALAFDGSAASIAIRSEDGSTRIHALELKRGAALLEQVGGPATTPLSPEEQRRVFEIRRRFPRPVAYG